MNDAERERIAGKARLKVARRRASLSMVKHYQETLKQTNEMLTLAIAAAMANEATWRDIGELLGVTPEQARDHYVSAIHDPYEKLLETAEIEEPKIDNPLKVRDEELEKAWYPTKEELEEADFTNHPFLKGWADKKKTNSIKKMLEDEHRRQWEMREMKEMKEWTKNTPF